MCYDTKIMVNDGTKNEAVAICYRAASFRESTNVEGKERNTQNLSRYEFIEFLVRTAKEKYVNILKVTGSVNEAFDLLI